MKTVLVTGANRGIGLSITKTLVNNNFRVIAISKSDFNLKKIREKNLLIYRCDLLNEIELNQLLCKLEYKNIDILINNAGIGKFNNIFDFKFEDWDDMINLNLTVPFKFIKVIGQHMKTNKEGKIINICSDASYLGFEEAAAYCASKHGLLGLSKALYLELKKYGINVTSICPGRVDTYFNNKKPGLRPNSLKDQDIADLILDIIKYNNRCNIESVMLSSCNE